MNVVPKKRIEFKNPNEIFGYPINNKTDKAIETKKTFKCKYLDTTCTKQSRLIKYPLGICSVNSGNSKPIICPNRFLENMKVFSDIATSLFKTKNNILLFSEVKLSNVGSFDFVLVKHKPISSKVEDFCVVEFQSDSTTGTGALVEAMKDHMRNIDISVRNYKFGMNTYNTLKLSYIQMLIKGQVIEKWNKNIVWVLQKFVYDNMVKRFCLDNLKYNKDKHTHFFIYDLALKDNLYNLQLIDKSSSSISNLLTAFTEQEIPSIGRFKEVLESKIKLNLGINIG
jgi:hypothetical protein